MFESLRKLARTWVAKGLMLLLVASFGIWGVSRSLIGGSTGSTVITVGDQQVGAAEYRLAYRRQLAALSQQFGTQLSPEQARAFGLEQQTSSQLVAGASLDQLAADMNLGLSQDRLAKLIGEDPAFKSNTGQFDRSLFTSRLANAGISQDDYINERSKVAVRGQIVDSISNGFKAPKTLVDGLKQFHDESRTIDYLILTNANIDPVKAPAEDVLAKWFDGVKSRYRAPEYRKISYVKLQAADVADTGSITDDAVRAEFEKRKESFTTPATRTIEQLSFANKDLADAASLALKTGTPFDQLVTDQGKTPSDVMLGTFNKASVPDSAIAEPAFAVAKDGGTTNVIQGSFGPVILRVTNIKQENAKSFDDVKEDLRKQMAIAAASSQIADLHDKFEDARGSGATLVEAAQQLKLKPVTIDAVDATGLDKAGNEVKDIPERQKLLTEAFKTEVGVQALPVPIGSDGYVWFDVLDVTPEHDRPLAEVHDKAAADWTAEQQKVALAAKAAALRDEAKKGKSLADIAAPLGIAVENKTNVIRNMDDAVLGRAGVAAAFSGPVDTVASAVGGDETTQILLKVTDVNATPPATDVLANQDQQIARIADAAGDDILDQMVAELQTKYGVTINREAAAQAVQR